MDTKLDNRLMTKSDPEFVCQSPDCGRRFLSEHVLYLHSRYHFRKVTKCLVTDCQYEAIDKQPFIEHLSESHSITPLECVYDSCDQLFPTHESFETHVSEQHLCIYRCHSTGCRQNFYTEDLVRQHVKYEHLSDNDFSCPISDCDYRCDRIERLNQHMDTHLDFTPYDSTHEICGNSAIVDTILENILLAQSYATEMKYKCNVNACGYRCARKDQLMRHRNVAHKHRTKPFIRCPHHSCSQRFPNEDILLKHLAVTHGSDYGFRCDYPGCHKVLKTRFSFTQHRKLHFNNEKPFKCPVNGCDKPFRTKYNRDTHYKRMHSGHKVGAQEGTTGHRPVPQPLNPFVCEWPGCTKRYRNKYLLKYHSMTHQKINCDVDGCGYSCADKRQLADHKDKHHSTSVKLIVTTTHESCGKKSQNKSILKERTIVKNKPYACRVKSCDYRSDRNQDLIRHMNTHKKGKFAKKGTTVAKVVKPSAKTVNTENIRDKQVSDTHGTDTKFRCDFPGCHKVLKTKTILGEHKKIHLNSEKQFKCPVNGCDKLFRTKYNRDTHAIRVHRSEQLFACEWKGCHFKTNQLRPFNAHKALHKSGQPPQPTINCPSVRGSECDTRSKSQPLLRNHSLAKPPDPVYACKWPGCEHKCASSSDLKTHRTSHNTATTGANFACKRTACRRRFKTKTELNAHMKSHNKLHSCDWKGCAFKAVDASKVRLHKKSKHENKK